MITPKQIDNSHGGRDRQAVRKKHPGTRRAKQQKQLRQRRPGKKSDSFFNALRDELGL